MAERLTEALDNSGYDPFLALVEVARDASVDLESRIAIHKHLLKYVYAEKMPVPPAEDGEKPRGPAIIVQAPSFAVPPFARQ